MLFLHITNSLFLTHLDDSKRLWTISLKASPYGLVTYENDDFW